MIDVDGAVRRARSYWFADGLSEIGSGVLFLGIGLWFLFVHLSAAGSTLHSNSALGFAAIVLAGSVILQLCVKRLKRRITYPRTGFVAYPTRKPWYRWLTAALGGASAITLVVILHRWGDALPAPETLLLGLVLAIAMWTIAHRLALLRFYALGAVSMGAALATTLLELEENMAQVVLFGALGGSLAVSGAVTLMRHLRQNRVPVQE